MQSRDEPLLRDVGVGFLDAAAETRGCGMMRAPGIPGILCGSPSPVTTSAAPTNPTCICHAGLAASFPVVNAPSLTRARREPAPAPCFSCFFSPELAVIVSV